LFSPSNFLKIFIAGKVNWRVHLARIKYYELVVLYKSKKGYEKYKAQKYYNLSKPFGKIAYREKKTILHSNKRTKVHFKIIS